MYFCVDPPMWRFKKHVFFPVRAGAQGSLCVSEALPLYRPHAREGPAVFFLSIFYVVFTSGASKSMYFYIVFASGSSKSEYFYIVFASGSLKSVYFCVDPPIWRFKKHAFLRRSPDVAFQNACIFA